MSDAARPAVEAGRVVARTLRGAWRAVPPPAEVSAEELVAVAPALLRTGSAPLAFWRSRALVASTPGAVALRDAWRFHAVQGAVLEERLPVAFSRLRAAGVEPLLAKGWAMARLYPQPGLRPYGDLDVYVRPADHAAARAEVDAMRGIAVDLHRGLPDLDDRDHDAVLSRAEPLLVGGVDVKVLAPEDHLRLLCRHFLRHGASRPVWLCDVGLLVEGRRPGFDWDLVLDGTRRRRQAVLSTLALAGALLGAELAGTPAADAATALPPWLTTNVLRQWGEGLVSRQPLIADLSRSAAPWAELRRRWPNAIEATAALDGPFNHLPRLPFQAAHVLARTVRFVLGLPRHLWRGRSPSLETRSIT